MPLSWNHQHRLGQSAWDVANGRHNPHHTTAAYAVEGVIDLSRLRISWQALGRRHPVLEARVALAEDEFVLGAHPVQFLLVQSDQESAHANLIAALAAPFDLESGPMARLVVVEQDSRVTLIGLAVEHLVSDGWSSGMLFAELARAYAGSKMDSHQSKDSAARDFPDFVRHQNQYLESPEGRAQIATFASELAAAGGAVPHTPLHGFSGRTSIDYSQNGSIDRSLSGELWSRVVERSRKAKVGPLWVVHAALHAAIVERSDFDEAATTLSTANRSAPGDDEIIGWLASKVVVRTQPSDHATVDGFLAEFARAMFGAIDSASVPWPRLIAALDPPALGRHTIHPYITFNAQPRRMADFGVVTSLGEVPLTPVPSSVGWHDASIGTFWREHEEGVACKLQWKTDWYGRADVDALFNAVESTLMRWTR